MSFNFKFLGFQAQGKPPPCPVGCKGGYLGKEELEECWNFLHSCNPEFTCTPISRGRVDFLFVPGPSSTTPAPPHKSGGLPGEGHISRVEDLGGNSEAQPGLREDPSARPRGQRMAGPVPTDPGTTRAPAPLGMPDSLR